MRKKCAAAIPSLLLVILLGALAVYGECAQAANHLFLFGDREGFAFVGAAGDFEPRARSGRERGG